MGEAPFLATTALEDFWDTTSPMLFLSPGCMRYSRKHAWSQLQYRVMRHPFTDRDKHDAAYGYTSQFYEKALPKVAEVMNQIHHVNYSVRYWRIVVGIWLLHITQILYEHYVALRACLNEHPDLKTYVLAQEDYVLLRNALDTMDRGSEDAYNLQLYSRLLKALGKAFPERRYKNTRDSHSSTSSQHFVKTLQWSLMKNFLGDRSTFMSHHFLKSQKEKWILFWKSKGRIGFDISRENNYTEVNPDQTARALLKTIEVEDSEFGKIFSKIMADEMPSACIERYEDIRKIARQRYPFSPKVIFTMVGFQVDEVFTSWGAACAEQGTILAGSQHGGNYGMAAIHPIEEHEKTITDRYYSWGWTEQGNKVKPMPAMKYLGVSQSSNYKSARGVLFSLGLGFRFFFRFHDAKPYNSEDCFQDQVKFVKSLPDALRKELRIRMQPVDNGFSLQERWKDLDTGAILEDCTMTFWESLENSRLHVTDHAGSTFADSLAVDYPTLLFWRKESYTVRPAAEPYLDLLREVGVLLDSPQEAAATVNRIYDHVDEWWNEKRRKLAVKEFTDRFAQTGPHGYDKWVKEFLTLANT